MSREAEIRRELIDKRLAETGWSTEKGNLVTELFLSSYKGQVKEQPSAYELAHPEYATSSTGGKRFADYALLDSDKQPIAIVEAKHDDRSPLEGQEQATEYADLIYSKTGKRPFIFLSNGDKIYFWDSERYPPREISGFYTVKDLENLASLRQYNQPLHLFQPDSAIVDREYQQRAVQAVIDGIKQKKRKFLLVMATGTGKTRTIIALVDLLLRANWIRRVLFLADRRELVKQAMDAFKTYLPLESCLRIEGGLPTEDARVHFATYPSMMQVYSQFSVGHYDLIIADESHRSIYKHYRDIFRRFDAFQIGLTATPTDYIEHNTYELFDCFEDIPTFEYPFETAVENDHLVDFRVLEAQTHFQIAGIKAGELPPEQQRQIVEQGLELSEISFEGSDLERKVTNTGTNDKIVDEFMDNCYKDSRGLPYKSIIFAVSHKHAIELLESFNRLYPNLQQRGLAKVIDSHMERAEKTLDDFKYKDMPRVAISVDMLDTGVDIPAIQTLVFAKPVYSQVKFWQMIGRGTRLWTDPITRQQKNDFIIIDHWDNFKTFDMNREGRVSHPSEPLPVRLFRLRLQKLAMLRTHQDTTLEMTTLNQLQEMVSRLPANNSRVQAHGTELAMLREDPAWKAQDLSSTGKLYRAIAPLMQFLPDVHAFVALFELHVEQLLLAFLAGDVESVDRLEEQIKDELAMLPRDLPEVAAKAHVLTWVESPAFWTHLSTQRILDMQNELAPLMRYRESTLRTLIKLHLLDVMKKRRWVTYGPAGEGAFVEDYKEQVEARVHDLEEQVPMLTKIKQNQQPSETEMEVLAALLNKPDLFIREEILQQVYENPDVRLLDFLKHILGVKHLPDREERIGSAINSFLQAHPGFSPIQRRFVYALRSVLLYWKSGEEDILLTRKQLEQEPFNRIGRAEDLFTMQELDELLRFANHQVA